MSESHSHCKDTGTDTAVVRHLITDDGSFGSVHDEPDVSLNAPDLDVGLIRGIGITGFVIVVIDKRFDNIEGANYDLALWVAYYNFLRPHKHAGNKVLNEVDGLKGADNMPGKWQLLIFLGQQTMLNLQNQTTTA